MKRFYLILIFCFPLLLETDIVNCQGLLSLGSEYDPDFSTICQQAASQWSIDIQEAEKNLSEIYQLLNFSAYNIDVISCNRIHSSALAYLDKNTSKRYILVNENRCQDLNSKYFSHLFIIAHEFAHHKLNHFNISGLITFEMQRGYELAADTYAAQIVKQMNGTLDDCITALKSLKHPDTDTYSSHPTLDKRINAVNAVFTTPINNVDITPTAPSYYEDKFQELKNDALLKYSNGLKPYDLSYYHKKTGLVPKSIIYFNGSYWIYWHKISSVSDFHVWWSYNAYPQEEVQEYFNKGFRIEFLEKFNGKWFIVLLKNETTYGQKVLTVTKTDFTSKSGEYDEKIKQNLDKGYSIQNLIENDSYYTILFTNTGSDGHYSWAIRNSYQDLQSWYKEKENDGYNYMYCFKAIGNNSYFSFMQTSNSVKDWTVKHFDGDNANEILAKLKDGYYIDNVTADASVLRFTISK